jgi:hypothetical protein
MGEIMRWRLTRAAQRRVPANTSLLQLGGPYSITSPTSIAWFKISNKPGRLQMIRRSLHTPASLRTRKLYEDI